MTGSWKVQGELRDLPGDLGKEGENEEEWEERMVGKEGVGVGLFEFSVERTGMGSRESRLRST